MKKPNIFYEWYHDNYQVNYETHHVKRPISV